MTKKAKIAIISGIILVVAFMFLPEVKASDTPASAINAETAAERLDYFASHGWEVEELYNQRIIIPSEFSAVYEEYAMLQDEQGLPLRRHKGEEAQLYVYQVKNYSPDGKNMLAELIVCNNVAVASMIYSEDQGSLRTGVN